MGLLLGPCAIIFLLTENVFAQKTETLEHRVQYFLDLGLLKNNNTQTFDDIVQKISAKYVEDWGQDYDKDQQFKNDTLMLDLLLLKYGDGKVWQQDTEADVLNGNAVYIQTISEWSAITDGEFPPLNIEENWASDIGPIKITFMVNGMFHSIAPDYFEDYLDMGLLKKINQLLVDTETKFEMLKPFDQTAVVLWLNHTTKKSLKKRGWKFMW